MAQLTTSYFGQEINFDPDDSRPIRTVHNAASVVEGCEYSRT